MDQNRFHALTRLMTNGPSRRDVLRGLAGAGLGLGFMRLPDLANAKKKHKKAPKPVFNAYGCLDVGQPCRGNSALCCSGVSKGKKPKKGKPDKRVCAAHHTADCTPQRTICEVEAPVLALCDLPSDTSACVHTTGNSVFCGSLLGFTEAIHCRACTKDSDCLAFGFAPGSACAIFEGSECGVGAVCANTEGRACVPPAGPA